jgi:hypothetical protein
MKYLSTNASDSDIIASRQFDEDSVGDESYYWFSALSGRAVVSEGAKYGSLLAAIADTNSEKGLHREEVAENLLSSRRKLLDTIFLSHDSAHVNAAISETRSSFILQMQKTGNMLSIDPRTIGEPVFSNGEYRIWKVQKLKQNFLN